jgi:hypothetical protein
MDTADVFICKLFPKKYNAFFNDFWKHNLYHFGHM